MVTENISEFKKKKKSPQMKNTYRVLNRMAKNLRNSLVVQWVSAGCFYRRSLDSIPSQRTKVLQASQCDCPPRPQRNLNQKHCNGRVGCQR